MNSFQKIEDVAAKRLCTGCGNCAFASLGKIKMVESKDENRRPKTVLPLNQEELEKVQHYCPALNYEAKSLPATTFLEKAWGPVLEVWEGYATDPVIRFQASSGGAITALSFFMMDTGKCDGTLHIKARKDIPYLNESSYSSTLKELREGCGSRYAPASVCDRLDLVENRKNPSVVVGKPCEIKALNQASSHSALLKDKLGLTISIFCAGVPSHKGTEALLKSLKPRINSTNLNSLKYRGEGWPGNMVAAWNTITGKSHERAVSYESGWGDILQKHRQWRCHICEDHTGEWADISVGDPWQNPTSETEKGKSLIVIRTEKARVLFHEAIRKGYIRAEQKKSDILFKAQPNLFATKGAVFGRILAMKFMGLAAPKLSAASFICWLNLPFKQKGQSIFGTVKRIYTRKLYLPKVLREMKGAN
ncbi:Coenzyme F420 hydrogenase/dehydrogenase, beta subunit C-terminal domain [Temperatibacter marinus]|uniref:Coenzyme F420 hydrogenase/dehydrogenase, beta subunit C-terminal domain n=1 Tax=Temperatibacter marinus TaxID=1456591 RepID=A0AA52H9K0_9PROT|nr:Coenzyme F420 hydrogenase/dehydrogenase, beta subunit C-terminal domain [Temperatibacter marinus]WND03276.1 Coenzyme F420 hydrogenase/dehydrogenase, beta subunit C-terminal domain [Temperatibacter marinus]